MHSYSEMSILHFPHRLQVITISFLSLPWQCMSSVLTPSFDSFKNDNCFSSSRKWPFTFGRRKQCSQEQHLVWVALSKNLRHSYLSATKKVDDCKDSYYCKSRVRKRYWVIVNRSKLLLIAPENKFHQP